MATNSVFYFAHLPFELIHKKPIVTLTRCLLVYCGLEHEMY
jgi:hypothetical protein